MSGRASQAAGAPIILEFTVFRAVLEAVAPGDCLQFQVDFAGGLQVCARGAEAVRLCFLADLLRVLTIETQIVNDLRPVVSC